MTDPLTRAHNAALNEVLDALDNVPDAVAIRAVALSLTGVDLRTAVFRVSAVFAQRQEHSNAAA